jgi:hypothetical protein
MNLEVQLTFGPGVMANKYFGHLSNMRTLSRLSCASVAALAVLLNGCHSQSPNGRDVAYEKSQKLLENNLHTFFIPRHQPVIVSPAMASQVCARVQFLKPGMPPSEVLSQLGLPEYPRFLASGTPPDYGFYFSLQTNCCLVLAYDMTRTPPALLRARILSQ